MENNMFVTLATPQRLRCCRVCLATDVMLLDIYSCQELYHILYVELTLIPVSPSDGLPQHLCNMCAALLVKSAAFRTKCRDTYHALMQLQCQNQGSITMHSIRNLDRRHLQPPFIITDIFNLNLPEDCIEETMSLAEQNTVESNNVQIKDEEIMESQDIKEEIKTEEDDCVIVILDEEDENMTDKESMLHSNDITMENANYSKWEKSSDVIAKAAELISNEIEMNAAMETNDPIANTEDNIISHENTVEKTSSKLKALLMQKNKRVKLKRGHSPDTNKETIINYLKLNSDRSVEHEKLFYDHILNKYFYKTKQNHYNDTEFESNCAKEVTDVPFVRTDNDLIFYVDKSNSDNVNTVEIKKKFYDYVKNKYIKKDPQYAKESQQILDIYEMKSSLRNMVWYTSQCPTNEGLAEFAKDHNFEFISLSKEEQIQDLQSRKDTQNYKNAMYKCEMCFRGYNFKATFENHMVAHAPEHGSIVCELCQKRFRAARKLRAHQLGHMRKFICLRCGMRCEWKNVKHHYEVHEGSDCICEHCGKVFKTEKARYTHVRVKHASTPCGICYETFVNSTGLRNHLGRAHIKTFRCATCDVTFDNKDAITTHIKTSPGDVCGPHIRPCAKCGENFAASELDQLEEHIRKRHPPRERRHKVGAWKRCCECKNSTSDPKEAGGNVEHYCPCLRGDTRDCQCPSGVIGSCSRKGGNATSRRHQGCCVVDRPKEKDRWTYYKNGGDWKRCCKCMDSTSDPDGAGGNLERHCPCTSGITRDCQCPNGVIRSCNREGGDPRSRSHHGCCVAAKEKLLAGGRRRRRRGSGPQTYPCPECSKCFKAMCVLEMHVRTHTGERPFACALCPKAFKQKAALVRHLKVHTGEKPFACPECGKTFSQSNSMKVHVATVHRGLPAPYKSKARRLKALQRSAPASGSDEQ